MKREEEDGGAAFPFRARRLTPTETICGGADGVEGKRSPCGLLTHHPPCGWSPALEKGGYIEERCDALLRRQLASFSDVRQETVGAK